MYNILFSRVGVTAIIIIGIIAGLLTYRSVLVSEINSLKSLVEEKERTISTRDKSILNYKLHIRDLDAVIVSKISFINEQRNSIEELEKVIDRTNTLALDRNKKLMELREALNNKESEVKTLKLLNMENSSLDLGKCEEGLELNVQISNLKYKEL